MCYRNMVLNKNVCELRITVVIFFLDFDLCKQKKYLISYMADQWNYIQ